MIFYGVFVASSWTNPKEQWCLNSDVRFFPCFSCTFSTGVYLAACLRCWGLEESLSEEKWWISDPPKTCPKFCWSDGGLSRLSSKSSENCIFWRAPLKPTGPSKNGSQLRTRDAISNPQRGHQRNAEISCVFFGQKSQKQKKDWDLQWLQVCFWLKSFFRFLAPKNHGLLEKETFKRSVEPSKSLKKNTWIPTRECSECQLAVVFLFALWIFEKLHRGSICNLFVPSCTSIGCHGSPPWTSLILQQDVISQDLVSSYTCWISSTLKSRIWCELNIQKYDCHAVRPHWFACKLFVEES